MIDQRLEVDPDFILTKRFGYSMQRLLDRYPEGAPDEVIAQALGIPVAQVEVEYQRIVLVLREKLQSAAPFESICP